MERMGTCGVCKFFKEVVDLHDCGGGYCYVDGPGAGRWVNSRETCNRHKEQREIAVIELRRMLEEIDCRLKGWNQSIADCKARIVEDTDLIAAMTPRRLAILAELEKRGVDDPDEDDDDD